MRSEGLLSSRLYGRPRSGRYAFTGSCAVGRSRALPPIRELHPCPEDRNKVISSRQTRLKAVDRRLDWNQVVSDHHVDALYLVVAYAVGVPCRGQRLNVLRRVGRTATQLVFTRLIDVPRVAP